jgi:hypothetical protein
MFQTEGLLCALRDVRGAGTDRVHSGVFGVGTVATDEQVSLEDVLADVDQKRGEL